MSLAGACTPPDAEAASRADSSPMIAMSERSPEFSCLREAIYFEAGISEPGRLAVAHVVMNRAQDPRFPGTICGVIADGQSRGACQFSYRCDGTPETFPDRVKFALADAAARKAAVEGAEDPTKGALFFHAASMPPGWFKTLHRTGEFGGNIFYRPGA